MAWTIILCVIVLAIAYIFFNYFRIRRMKEGTREMVEMAGIIRSGASTFLKTEYKTIAVVVILVAAVFTLFVERTSGITFLLGACMSSCVCILGMRSATYANVRTANRARETLSIGETVKVALCGGSISGLSVQAFGMLGLILVLIVWRGVDIDAVGSGLIANLECNPSIMRISTYSLGCSLVAMFNRVAGGNYTKAADISSDILAKLRHDMPEDDSRVPNVVADFIGDNVNDIAGNCSDLLESFVATMAAAIMIAVTIFNGAVSGGNSAVTGASFNAICVFLIVLAGGGLLGCLLGLGYASLRKMGDNPSRELNLATWISAGLTVVIGFFAALIVFKNVPLYDSFRLGWISPWLSSVLGIVSGIAIGSITEYYTSTDYKPTRKLAQIATEGEAFVITKGDAIRAVPLRQALRHLRHRAVLAGHAGLRGRDRVHRRLRLHRGQRRRPGGILSPAGERARDHRQAGRGGQHHRSHRQGLRHRLRSLRNRVPDRGLRQQLHLRQCGTCAEHRILRGHRRRHHRRRTDRILLRTADRQHHRIRPPDGG